MWQHSDALIFHSVYVNCVSCVPWEKVSPCGRSWRWAFSLFFCYTYKSPPFCMFSSATLKLRSAATCLIICVSFDGIWDAVCSCDHGEVHKEPWSTHSFIPNNQDGVWDLFILLGSNLSQMCFENIGGHLRGPGCQSWRIRLVWVWPMSHLLTTGLQPATRGPPGLHTRASYEDADSRFIFDLLSGLS